MAKPRHFVAGIVALALIFFICTSSQISSFLYPAHSQTSASVTHTVLFQFSAKAKADDVKAVSPPVMTYSEKEWSLMSTQQACDRFLSLKESCIHPTKQAPYIVSLKGGKDNSPEGLQVRCADSPNLNRLSDANGRAASPTVLSSSSPPLRIETTTSRQIHPTRHLSRALAIWLTKLSWLILVTASTR